MFSLDWLLVIFVLLMENLDATLLGSRTSRQTAGQTVHAWVSAPECHVWGGAVYRTSCEKRSFP